MLNECAPLIKTISEIIEKKANALLREYDVTSGQVHILVALSQAENAEYTLKELEEMFHVSQATIAGIVSRLELKHLVQGNTDINDRRVKRVKLTASGHGIAMIAKEKLAETEDWMLKDLKLDDRKKLKELLETIYRTIE